MPAYFIVDLEIRDRVGFQDYARAVEPVLRKYGARYLVAGQASDAIEVLEGDWRPKKLTVIEFSSKARAKEFFGPEVFASPATRLRLRKAQCVASID